MKFTTPDFIPSGTPHKMIENKNFRSFPCQDMLSICFHFGVFEIFVSSLFLVHFSLIKPYCVSVTYEELTAFEEEDNDVSSRMFFYYRSIPCSTTVFLVSKKMSLIIIMKHIIFLKFNTKHIEFEDF